MRQSKISRRSFLLSLGFLSSAAVLTACGRGQRFLQRIRLLFPARRARILDFQ